MFLSISFLKSFSIIKGRSTLSASHVIILLALLGMHHFVSCRFFLENFYFLTTSAALYPSNVVCKEVEWA